MSETFFTSDTHFGHNKVLEYDKRPFTSIEEHDEKAIEVWNATIRPSDRIIHLGDVCFSNAVLFRIMPRLNGQKFLVCGNHDDKVAWKNRHKFFVGAWQVHYMQIGEHKIFLSHYAHRVWRGSHRGSFHLHGHSHGQLPDGWGRSMDVGFPCTGYKPISWDAVFENLKDREMVNHHPLREKDLGSSL